jgi:hypothetical protein
MNVAEVGELEFRDHRKDEARVGTLFEDAESQDEHWKLRIDCFEPVVATFIDEDDVIARVHSKNL